ncbi:MAG: flagellar filament capping protein FliD [Candidatus Acidiferrales bacterium]|jgi:flagellar hook-associated protein 2
MSTTTIGTSVLNGSQSTSGSGGLGAGIDISALVQASLAPQTAELTVLQGDQTTITNQQTALNSFNNDIQTLQNAVFALSDPAGQLTDVVAASSNSAVLTASATAGTPSGSHTITVTSLASTSSAYSNAVATSSTPIATGTLSIQVGTNTAVPITINGTNNTLDGLAQTINNTANIGVTASVITDANGARLALVSNTSGAPGNLTITPSAGVVGFNTGVTGANAALNVDGIPISSTTNTVSSAIPGVTLSLTGTTGDVPVSVTTGPDVTQQESAVNSFVSAYNTVIGDINTQSTIGTNGQPGPLGTDSTLALGQGELLAAVAFSQTGNGNINSISDLGISFNNDGTLTVNSGSLATALQANPAAVQAFFQGATTGNFGTNLTNTLNNIANPITGAVATDIAGLAQSQISITQQISDFQAQLATTTQQLTAQYVQVDTTLQELPELLDQINQQLNSLG